MATIYNFMTLSSNVLSSLGQCININLLFLIIDHSHYLVMYILLAVLGSFLAALNRFIADRYSWNHSVSEYHVYEFFKVNLKLCLPKQFISPAICSLWAGDIFCWVLLAEYFVHQVVLTSFRKTLCRYGTVLEKEVCLDLLIFTSFRTYNFCVLNIRCTVWNQALFLKCCS